MYDTVNFWLPHHEAGVYSIDEVAGKLSNVKEIIDRDTGETKAYGNMENLKITVYASGVSIKGSLAKYYYQDNTYTLTRHDVKEAIAKLSDTLGIDLKRANITRMDVSANFMMKRETERYFEVLGMCTYFNRVQASKNTLYYQSQGKNMAKAMAFYDKAREMEHTGNDLPDVFKGCNLLRYESRWITRLPHQLKENEVTGGTLSDEKFYQKVIRLWGENYFNIEKKRTLKADAMENLKTVSDCVAYICAFALQRVPAEELQQIISKLKEAKVFNNRTDYTRLRKKIKDIATKADITEADVLVKELDEEVRQVLAYKR